MNVSLGDLLVIRDDMQKVFDKDIPIKTAWSLSKIIKVVEGNHEIFETNRIKILKEYVPDGEKRVPEDSLDEFKEKIQELLDVDVELGIDRINIEDLGDISISPLSLSRMAFLFSE